MSEESGFRSSKDRLSELKERYEYLVGKRLGRNLSLNAKWMSQRDLDIGWMFTEIDRLQSALAEALRDAERYRWLRNHGPNRFPWPPYVVTDGVASGDSLDAAIDAAIKEQP